MSINRRFAALGMCGCLGFFGFLLLATHPTFAQSPARRALATAKSLACVFPVYATGSWKNGQPQAEVKTTTLSLLFDSINTEDGTARVAGAFGPSDIIVRLSQGNLHLMQVFDAGPLYTTTVFDKETSSGKLQAVHTRHEYTDISLPGFTSRPEQYYGECEVRP